MVAFARSALFMIDIDMGRKDALFTLFFVDG
jgi:hypothetical protein